MREKVANERNQEKETRKERVVKGSKINNT